jgi:hypothetical protein
MSEAISGAGLSDRTGERFPHIAALMRATSTI